MKSVWINRILLLLAATGVFVAGFLTYTYLNHLSIPCGMSNSCDYVASTEFARVGPIPTPAFGLLGYTVLFLFAGLRTFLPQSWGRKTVLPGFVVAILGAVVSGLLMHILYNVLRTSCEWCLYSAILMFAQAVLYSFLASQEWEAPAKPIGDQILTAVAIAAVVTAIAIKVPSLTRVKEIQVSREWTVHGLEIPDYRFVGSKESAMSIIEVADYYCDTCRTNSHYLEELKARFGNKVGLGYISLPLINKEGHELSGVAAIAAEIAGEKDQFWRFTEKMYSPAGKDTAEAAGIFAILESLGFNANEVQERVANEADPAYDRFQGSFEAIRKLGIDRTPSFIVMWKARGGIVVDKEGLERILSSPETEKLLTEGDVGQK